MLYLLFIKTLANHLNLCKYLIHTYSSVISHNMTIGFPNFQQVNRIPKVMSHKQNFLSFMSCLKEKISLQKTTNFISYTLSNVYQVSQNFKPFCVLLQLTKVILNLSISNHLIIKQEAYDTNYRFHVY